MGAAREFLSKNTNTQRAKPIRRREPPPFVARGQHQHATKNGGFAARWVSRVRQPGSCSRTLALHPSYADLAVRLSFINTRRTIS